MEISSTLRKNKARTPKAIIQVPARHGAALPFVSDPRGEKREGNKPEEDGENIEGENSPVVVCNGENQPCHDDVNGYEYCCQSLGVVWLVVAILRNEESTHGKEYQRVPVKGVVSNAVRSKSEDNDCCDELGGSQTYKWL